MLRRALPLFVLAAFPAPAEDWRVRVFSTLSRPVVTLGDIDDPANEEDFETNNDMVPGVEIQYRQYGIRIAQSVSGTSRLDPSLPPTRFVDLKAFYHGSRWGVQAYHQYFRGFFAADRLPASPDYSSMSERTWNLNVFRGMTRGSKVYHMTEGLGRTGFKANAYYLAGMSRQGFKSPVALKDSTTDNSGAFAGIREITGYGLFAGLGTTLNANLGGFYLDPTLFLGGGPQYRQSNANGDGWGPQIKVNLQLRVGYQGDRFGAGMDVENDLNSIELDDARGILFHSTAVKMHAGLSF
jgi:hypothetical protein